MNENQTMNKLIRGERTDEVLPREAEESRLRRWVGVDGGARSVEDPPERDMNTTLRENFNRAFAYKRMG